MSATPAPSPRPVAFWLVPGHDDRAHWRTIVDELALRHGAPGFEPHVTLHAGVRHPQDDVEELLSRVASTTAPLVLRAGATRHSELLFKSLFVEFDAPAVLTLGQALKNGLAEPGDYRLEPHLSLLYKVLPIHVRGQLASQHDFLGREFVFSEIAAVRPGADALDWADVRGWDAWLRRPLARSG